MPGVDALRAIDGDLQSMAAALATVENEVGGFRAPRYAPARSDASATMRKHLRLLKRSVLN